MIAPGSLPPILPARSGHVLTVTMNRPDTRNALSEHMMRLLQLTLDEAVEDESVRVIVLAAKGPAFSSGHDLKEMTGHRHDPDKGLAYYRALFAQCSRLMQTIVRHPKPVIAQVQALATAAGCQLVASCDLAVASTEARFATPGVNIGLFCSTPMVPLYRVVGTKRALEMLLTGDMIDAVTALEWGLVNRVVPAADLDAAVAELATRLTRSSSRVLALGKRAFWAQAGLTEAAAYALACPVMVGNAADADADEGMRAFLAKRAPQWPTP